MRHRAVAGVVVALGVLTATAAGCKQRRADDAPARERPEALSAPERKLATDACNDFVARLCACAQAKPELAETCKLKKAKPEALALALEVADDPSSPADAAAQAKAEVGKIVARCIEEAAQLPALGCR